MEQEKNAEPSHHEGIDQRRGDDAEVSEDPNIGKWAAIRQNPRAFAWAVSAAWQILLVSYENQAAGLVVGIPRFRQDFGSYRNGGWVLPPAWQGAHSGGPVASQAIGALFSGQVADWIGRKRTVMGALVVSFASITVQVLANTNPMFFGGKFLNGFAVGTLKAVSTTYIGEVAPLPLRGLMTCLIGLGYTIGPFAVSLILNSTGTFDNAWAYRAVFVSQYGVAAISAIFVFFMPESPWWLANKGAKEKAIQSLRRLGHSADTAARRYAEIELTLEQARSETSDVSYLECFRASNLRRTMISIAPLLIQSLAGSLFMQSYTLYYAQLAGFSGAMSFRIQIAAQVLSIGGNVVSWFLVDRLGRQLLMLLGVGMLLLICTVQGALDFLGTMESLRGAVSMCLLYSFFYNTGIGAVAFTILAEVSTSRLRVKTIAFGLCCQNALNVMWSFTLPYLFNPDQLALGGKLGFVFAGTSIVSLVYVWFCQPETRGRTYAELDEMFALRIGARQFKRYKSEVQAQAQSKVVDGDD
ncbi:maltose high-affinity maltose transporter (alpha-glucoside transporter) [Colletotrichum plurivorum]|uniref:Maltose high-affinity maltose transporter (Alpha-glucoside transporter) n=1 Tax=Colletotrichum plurivorum TaxID=2175906 RepID=A0A8H6JG33_9PEZI|nr:maltose high-affinity maltose transporter (alpha-glucoside transporter) [Colletotrichum plurivorum]